jgi:hypothetical protein
MTSSLPPKDAASILSPASTEALRSALRLHFQQPRGDADRRIGSALSAICDEARRDQIPAERLLVAFKSIWTSLPEVRRLPPDRAAAEIRSLVTLCIERYYASE